MSYATAAPHHFPYRHRTVEQVDRENARSIERNRARRKHRRSQHRAEVQAL